MYEDDRIRLDEHSLTIRTRRGERKVPITAINDAQLFKLSLAGGRFRLVGLDFRRPRTWFHWDPKRHAKTAGVELDVGRVFKIAVTPEDAEQLLSELRDHPSFAHS